MGGLANGRPEAEDFGICSAGREELNDIPARAGRSAIRPSVNQRFAVMVLRRVGHHFLPTLSPSYVLNSFVVKYILDIRV